VNIPRRLLKILRPLATHVFCRVGTIRTIFAGPCRGLKYRIFPQFGWSYLYGGWEPEAQAVMLRAIKPGMTTYDLGANYGMHALLMARLVGAAGNVYAFEPVPNIFNALKENVEINQLKQIKCIPSGVWDKNGKIQFFTGDHLGAGHIAEAGDESGSEMQVDVVSLDDFIFNQGHHPPDFIKIDVEGAEGKALCGAWRSLETYHPTLLIDLHNPEQDVAVGSVLQRLGYKARRTSDHHVITNLSAGWPTEDGIWGQIVAW
jgi:FkbM family methyltransferase